MNRDGMTDEQASRADDYRARENQHTATELVVSAAAARYVATIQAGETRVLAERVSAELMRRAAALLGVP